MGNCQSVCDVKIIDGPFNFYEDVIKLWSCGQESYDNFKYYEHVDSLILSVYDVEQIPNFSHFEMMDKDHIPKIINLESHLKNHNSEKRYFIFAYHR